MIKEKCRNEDPKTASPHGFDRGGLAEVADGD
jgi:hypothetical protein